MTASKDERAGFGSVPVQELPQDLVFKAAAFAVGEHGSVADGITPLHLIAVGSYLFTEGLKGLELNAYIAKAYELMQAAQNSVH